ncbi:MAG: hypothetical protein O3A71_06700 [Proteobacteria bacterium]|nr:hypothetical protein [Pseudomonadota bacterium]
MIRLFAWSLLVIVVALALSLTLGFPQDPGYLLIAFGNSAFETSIFAMLIAVCVVYAVLRLGWILLSALNPWRLVSAGRRLRARRKANAKRSTIQGLLSLVRGDRVASLKLLERGIREPDASSVNFLGLAYVANQNGDVNGALEWLDKGEEAYPDAKSTLMSLRAEILLQANRLEECVAVLQHLRSNSPADTTLLRLLNRVYAQLEDWDSLEKLLPVLIKYKALSAEKLSELADRVLLGLLRNSASNLSDLQQLWKKAKASQCETPALVIEYSNLLLQAGDAEGARRALEKALKKRWESETLLHYGKLESGLALKQLLAAEQWQRSRPSDAALLLTLARLSLRCELWGKAREYYEATLAIRVDANSLVEYAELMRGLSFDSEADAAMRSALETAGLTSSLPVPPRQ